MCVREAGTVSEAKSHALHTASLVETLVVASTCHPGLRAEGGGGRPGRFPRLPQKPHQLGQPELSPRDYGTT